MARRLTCLHPSRHWPLGLVLAALCPAAAQPNTPPPPWLRRPTVAVVTHLVDDDGRPLRGAWVHDLAGGQSLWVGPDGRVAVRGFGWYAGGPTELSLRVALPGWSGYCYGRLHDPQCVPLTRVGNLVGSVIDAAGRPLPGVTIACDDGPQDDPTLEPVPWAPPGTLVTDEAGQWLLPNVPRDDDVTLRLRVPGEREPRRFTVWAGHTVCRVGPRPRERAVTGRIQLPPDYRPTDDGVEFTATHPRWGQCGEFNVTAREGQFTLWDPPVGPLRLASPRHSLVLEPTDTCDVPERGVLDLGTLRARRLPLLTVTVQRPDGQPAGGARLYWELPLQPGEEEPDSGVREADAQGCVRLYQAPGPVQLSADDGRFRGRLDVVQTAAGLRPTLRLGPAPRQAMRVRLVDQRGEPFWPAELNWAQGNYTGGPDEGLAADSSGRATLTVWPDAGPLTLNIASEALCYEADQVVNPVVDRELTITVPVAGCFAVLGRLVDREGRAVAGEPVRLRCGGVGWSAGESAEQSATTNGAGEFAFARVGCWTDVRLRLPRRPGVFAQLPYLPPVVGPRTFGILTVPGLTAVCSGQVVDADGRPAAQAEVLVCGTRHSTRTDAAGRFRLAGLRTGSVRLLALAGDDLRAEATVPEGMPVQLRLKRWRLTAELCREQAAAELRSAADAARGQRAENDDRGSRDTVAVALALVRVDAAEALRLFDTAPAATRRANLAEVLESVAQCDPDLAARELRRLREIQPPAQQRLTTARVAAFLAPTRREAALRLLEEVRGYQPDSPQRLELELARARLAAWLGRPEAVGWAESAAAGFAVGRAARSGRWVDAVETSGAAWLAEWPELVERFCAGLPYEGLRQAARAAAVARLAAVAPDTAVALHHRWFPPSCDAADGPFVVPIARHLRLAALRLAEHDPATAVDWAAGLPQLADRRAVWLAAARRTADRVAGEAWLIRLRDSGVRPDALAPWWQRWDPARATALLASAERLAAQSGASEAPRSWAVLRPNAGRRWLEFRAAELAGADSDATGRLPSTQYAVLDPVRYRELSAGQDAFSHRPVSLARVLLTLADQLEPEEGNAVPLPWVLGRWSE